jgi:hypothetical protein
MNETGNSFMVQPLDTRVCSNSTRVFVGNACRSKEVVHLNLTRFHGVFAPNSKYRALVTPAKPAYMPSLAITWAKRLKRVFDIDIETCSECGGNVKIIASIEDPAVIQKILAHLDDNVRSAATAMLPDCRASPTVGLLV